MEKEQIVDIALENLQKHTGIKGKWTPNHTPDYDGTIHLIVDDKPIAFHVQVKNELRAHHLLELLERAKEHMPFMVVTGKKIPATLTGELQKNKIAFLELNGGKLYFDVNQRMFWIVLNVPTPKIIEDRNRAFTATGLKVIFHFLLDEQLINKTYREIAETTGVALGNINYVIHGLKEEGYLINLTKDTYKLTRKKELLMKWIEAYHQYLKPKLKIGTFKFVNNDAHLNWKELKLKEGETYWGGEPAGDLLTNYLQPGEFTMYTTEGRQELIREYKILPADNGNVFIYKKFWNFKPTGNTVPEILAYADLVDTPDRRKQETAQKIYERYVQNKF